MRRAAPSQRVKMRGGPISAAVAPAGAVVCELDDFTPARFCALAAAYSAAECAYVVTPNVDHLLRYHDDPAFRVLYGRAAYILLDSRVVSGALRLMNGLHISVCPGSDLTAALLGQVATSTDRIVLIGGSSAQAQILASRFGLGNTRHHEPPMGLATNCDALERCVEFIEAAAPFRFCFVAVGSPQQEMIAHRLHERGRCAGLVLCVGASLNFLTGAERRAPRWMQRLALEWLFRLANDPRRMAARYLVRGPRIFALLLRRRLVLRRRSAQRTAVQTA